MGSVKKRTIQKVMIGSAALCGLAIAFSIGASATPDYRFSKGHRPIRISTVRRGKIRGILRIYNLHIDWNVLSDSVEREFPLSIVREGNYHGLRGTMVVVPRREGGRAKLFECPIREITVIKGIFALDKSGIEVPKPGDGTWSGIMVVEFPRTPLFESARNWFRERLHV